MCWLRIWTHHQGTAVQQGTRKGPRKENAACCHGDSLSSCGISRSHARLELWGNQVHFYCWKYLRSQGKKIKKKKRKSQYCFCFAWHCLLSGLRGHLPSLCPHQQHVFSVGKEKEMREAALRVGEVTHLRLVFNPFSAADFLCVCKSRSNQEPWHP